MRSDSSSTSSSEAVRPVNVIASVVASSGRGTGQVLAAPAGTAGSAARSAQEVKAGASGLQAAGSGGRVRSRDRAGKAVKEHQRHPARATAQSIVRETIAGMERAADALAAMLMEAAQAATASRQAFEFLQLVQSSLVSGSRSFLSDEHMKSRNT